MGKQSQTPPSYNVVNMEEHNNKIFSPHNKIMSYCDWKGLIVTGWKLKILHILEVMK